MWNFMNECSAPVLFEKYRLVDSVLQIALFKVIEIAGNQVFLFRSQLDGLFHVFCRTGLVAHQQVNTSSFLIQLRFLRNQFNSFLIILERLVQLFFFYQQATFQQIRFHVERVQSYNLFHACFSFLIFSHTDMDGSFQ